MIKKMNKYSGVHTIEGKKAIWLQSYGFAPAKLIEKFKKGDVMLFNYGDKYTVVSMKKISPKFYEVKMRSPKGKIYPERVKAGTYRATNR